MADTTDLKLFDVPLKLIAVQDPGNRDAEIWEAFNLDEAEDAKRVSEVIRAAVSGRPYLQVVTDQGTPYRAAQARATYEDLGLEYVPTKEGAPTRKATLERSFGLVKQILTPLIFLTSSLVTTIPSLRNPWLAKTLGKYLVAIALDAFRIGRDSSIRAPARPQDRQVIETLVQEITDRNRDDHGSCRLLLERIHEEYQMGGSRESFVRSLRHHVLEDVQEAERRLRTRACRCVVLQCDRYFVGILRNVTEEGRARRRRDRGRAREDHRRRREDREFEKEQALLSSHPETRILRGLKLITLQWDPGSQSLFMDGRGMGYVDLKDGLRDLRERNGVTQARDEAEAIWRNWERQGLPLEPGTVASIRRRGPGQKIGNRRRSGVHKADRAQHNSRAVPSLNPRSPPPGRCGIKRQVLWVHHHLGRVRTRAPCIFVLDTCLETDPGRRTSHRLTEGRWR